MHDKFKELLANYTIDSSHIEPLKIQLQYTWENLTERKQCKQKKTFSSHSVLDNIEIRMQKRKKKNST